MLCAYVREVWLPGYIPQPPISELAAKSAFEVLVAASFLRSAVAALRTGAVLVDSQGTVGVAEKSPLCSEFPILPASFSDLAA